VIAQLQSYRKSGFSVWVGPEIASDDADARLFLSQYLTKCPVMLTRISIERQEDKDVVRYSSDCLFSNGIREFTPLDFLAELSARRAESMQIILSKFV
jgi:hypothetical protein